MLGSSRRARLATLVATVTLLGGLSVAASSPASAQTVTHTFAAVHCTAVINGTTISQNQDVTVSITAPDHVTPGQAFTVTFPSSTSVLPSSSNGLTITSYSNISLSYQAHSTTFNSGTIVNPGFATINGNSTPETASLSAPDTIVMGEPGPFPPGTLVTPDISVQATAGAAGSSITLNALTLTTSVTLNGSIHTNVTCNIPQDTLITIPVNAAISPPTVNAGPDVSGSTNTPIALSGTVTDPSTTPTDGWTSSDPACTFASPTSPATAVTCSQPGTFTVTLTADDGVNAPVSDSAQVVVTQTVPLTVSAGGVVTGVVSHALALHGSVSDPGHTPTVAWTANSPACTFSDAGSASTAITCTATGNYVATITADDGVNPPASDAAAVTVNPDLPPSVNAGPDVSGSAQSAITVAGSASDPEGDPLTFHWTSSSPSCTFGDASQAATTITCTTQGNYTATLTVNDGFNPAVSDTAAITVTDILFPFNWDVNATTHLKKLNMDVTVPKGNFTGVVDLTTGQLTGDITLPPAQVNLSLAGFGLVTANMQITEAQPITGTLDVSTFQVTATAVFNIKVLSAYPTATPFLNIVGNTCQTSTPVSVTMSGLANLTGSSTFSGLYTIPSLANCGLATTALNLVIPGPGNTFSATVAPPPVAPSITTQPADQTVAPGQSYSFGAAASGSPDPTVQWQVSTDGGSTFTNISGATTATYSAAAALADSGKQFRAVFTNGTGTATTDAATLTVAVAPDAPTIGTATAGASTATVAFTPPANTGGSPVLDYGAQCTSSDGGASGSATGAASPISVAGLTPGSTYTCTATARNTIGSSVPSAASNSVVPTAPPSVTTQPSDSTVLAGQSYSFTAAASGSPAPTVQWRTSTDNGASFHDVPGATSPTLTATAAPTDSGTQFEAVFTNSTGTVTTTTATLTVTSVAPEIASQPADEAVTIGQSYSFTAGATGAPAPTAQWQKSTNDGATFSVIPGATGDTLTGTAAMSDSGSQFRAVYTNVVGTATTNVVTLTVSALTTISIGNASVVEGNSGKNRTATVAVTLAQPAAQNVTVHYATSGGTATAATDYLAKSGTLTFKPGKTVLYVAIAVEPDTTPESNETIQIPLSSPTGGYSLAPSHSTGVVTIIDDDSGSSALQVSVGDAQVCRAYSGPLNVAKILVSLSAPATSPVSVRISLAGGTATGGVDYKTWATKTLTFNTGQFQKVVAISVFAGAGASDKTALLTLSNPSAGLSIERGVGTLTITNHD